MSLQAYFIRRFIRRDKNQVLKKYKRRKVSIAAMRKRFIEITFRDKRLKSVAFERFDLDGIPSAWFRPKNARQGKVILYFHGGGYCVGSIDTHDGMVSKIANLNQVTCLLPEYRLGPEHPFPGAVDDAVKSYQFLLQNHKPEDIILMGDSAGGGLSIACLLKLKELQLPLPAAAALLSPWLDLSLSLPSMKALEDTDPFIHPSFLDSMASDYAGQYDRKDPLLSPVFGDLKNLPPLFIQVGEEEVLLDDSQALAEKAKAEGVEVDLKVWKSMWHVWQYFWRLLPEASKALKEQRDFIGKIWQ